MTDTRQVSVRDLWQHVTLPGTYTETYSVELATHANNYVRLKPPKESHALKEPHRQARGELEQAQGPSTLNTSARDNVAHISPPHDQLIL